LRDTKNIKRIKQNKMSDQVNIFEDLITSDNKVENIFEDLVVTEEQTKTPLPGMFDMERYTDKKKFIGDSEFLEDYELVDPNKMDFFDKFVFQTLGGNEEVYRQKKSQFGENFLNALNSRDTAAIVGALGGYEGVRILANNALKTVFKKNPVVATMYAIGGGTLGATGMEQMYDRVKGFITGDEETLEEIWQKIPKDLKRNLGFEAFGVGIASIPMLAKRILMTGKPGAEELYKLSKKFNIDFLPIDVASNFSKSFLKVGGIFPGVTGPFGLKKKIKKRGTTLAEKLDDIFYSLIPTRNLKQSELGETLMTLATESYKNFRKTVGKQYNKFLDLASGIKDGQRIKDFDVNIVPLMNRNIDSGGNPYLLDVARKIIAEAQAGGKGQLSSGHPNYDQAYAVALDIVDRFGGKKFMDVKTLHNYVKLIGKKYIKQSYAKDGGASVPQLVELKDAIKTSFGDLDLTKIDADLADEILAQYKIADNMYKNGWEEGGKFFEGKPLYERAFAGQFEKVKANLFDTKLTTEGKKYYDQIVKEMIKFNSKEGIDDLYKLLGQDDVAFGTFIRAYLDDALNATAKSKKGAAGEAAETFNYLNLDIDEFIKKLGFRDATGAMKGTTVPIQEEALTHALNILNKNNKLIPSGKDFRNFLNIMENQKNIKVPDVAEFIRRTAVFGGIGAIVGNYLGFLNIGHVGIAGGLGLIPTLGARSIANALSNPKNVEILFDAVNPKLSYYKRYSAGIRLLDIAKNHLLEQSAEATGEAKEEIDKILEGFDIFYKQAIENAPQSEDDEEPIEFQGIIEDDTTDDEIITDEEIVDIPVNVPVPNKDIEMAQVVASIPNPVSRVPMPSGPAGMDPDVVERLENVGLPLFSKHGGIASLLEQPKPRQMVA
jgi:hypothetical protein